MFKIRFHILQTWTFYDLSSFFDLSKAFFHKLIFFQKNFFSNFFFKNNFFSILFIINWCPKYVFIYTRLWSFMIYHHFLTASSLLAGAVLGEPFQGWFLIHKFGWHATPPWWLRILQNFLHRLIALSHVSV